MVANPLLNPFVPLFAFPTDILFSIVKGTVTSVYIPAFIIESEGEERPIYGSFIFPHHLNMRILMAGNDQVPWPAMKNPLLNGRIKEYCIQLSCG